VGRKQFRPPRETIASRAKPGIDPFAPWRSHYFSAAIKLIQRKSFEAGVMHNSRIRTEIAVLSLLMLAAFTGAVARTKPRQGALAGLVLNSKGAAVKAVVFWQTADGKAPRITRTDASGRFSIPAVREGLYDLRAEAAGMTSEWKRNVLVKPGTEASVTLRLTRRVAQPASLQSAPAVHQAY
jgi:hypothetical protein